MWWGTGSRRVGATIIAAAVLLLAGCGDDSESSTSETDPRSGTETSDEANTSEPLEDGSGRADEATTAQGEADQAGEPEPTVVLGGEREAGDETRGSSSSPADVAGGQPTAIPLTPPSPDAAPFGDGLHVVGTDIVAGRYRSEKAFCFWERLGPVDTVGPDRVLGSGSSEGPSVVDILADDIEFRSDLCDQWAPYEVPDEMSTSFGAGDWVMGADIGPGRYRSDGGPTCRWSRLRGFTGSSEVVVAVGDIAGGTGSTTDVVLLAEDAGFRSSGCGPWALVE